ncbi:CBS domain-containing protein [Streptomyces caeni]|uniref:CBS domain-containing protein n=1 Tax=Streptomyces caeni TaxID=2307231 RepID=A0ABW4IPK5_9ACTN
MQRTPHLVSDVMTGRVVAVSRDATFKDIVKTLRQWEVSALPVVEGERKKVVGVVSEADLLRKEEFRDRDPGRTPRLQGLSGLAKADAVTAQDLMTAPAVTVRATATLAQAARIMARAGVKRLPVVGDEGALVGIVSRADLLTVFMRDDEDIAEEVRDEIIARLFPELREPIQVEVHDGVVKLTGRIPDTTLVPITTRLVRGVEGVVDVDCALVGLPRRPALDPDLPQATRRPWGAGTIT